MEVSELLKIAKINTIKKEIKTIEKDIWEDVNLTGYSFESDNHKLICLGKMKDFVVFLENTSKEVKYIKRDDIHFTPFEKVIEICGVDYKRKQRSFDRQPLLEEDNLAEYYDRKCKVEALEREIQEIENTITMETYPNVVEDYEEKVSTKDFFNEFVITYNQMVNEYISSLA